MSCFCCEFTRSTFFLFWSTSASSVDLVEKKKTFFVFQSQVSQVKQQMTVLNLPACSDIEIQVALAESGNSVENAMQRLINNMFG